VRLHRLVLTDVKGVSHRELRFPDHGVVVLQGPNEVGKSTLLEAFDRLLDPRSKATSRSARVKELQPVGRDVGPYVEAEFTVGRHRVRFAKRWLRNPTTTLTVLTPRHEQLSGAAAQERMDAILEESLDRSLWDALRFAQAGEAVRSGLTDSAVLTRALDGASGADRHADGGEALLELVEREYLRYFTPTGRTTGELRQAMSAVNAAQSDAVLAHQRLVETRQLLSRHEALEQQAASLAERRPELVGRCGSAQEAAAEVERLTQARNEAMNRLEQAQERSVRAAKDVREREQTVEALRRAEDEASRMAATIESDAETLMALEQAADAAAEAQRAARDAVASARLVADQAQADVDLWRDISQAEDLARRIELVETALQQAVEVEHTLTSLTVTSEMVRRIEAAEHEVRVRRSQHEQQATVVAVEGLADGLRLSVDGEDRALAAGEAIRRTLADELVVELPGQLRITLQPAAEDRHRGRELKRAEDQLRDALSAAGMQSLESARAANEARTAAQTEKRRYRERLADLGVDDGIDRLQHELGELQTLIRAAESDRPADCPFPAELAQARAVCQSARASWERAEATARTAGVDLRTAEQRLVAAQRRDESRRGSLAALCDQVRRAGDALEQAREERPDEALQQAVAGRTAEYARVEAVAAEARRALASADADRVRSRLASAEQRLADHDQQASTVREQLVAVRAQVELTSGEGRQEVYDRALATFRQLREELEAVDRRARAARQLYETLQRHRQEAHDAYVRPFTEALERLGRTVYGPTFGVQVDGQLTITGRQLNGTLVPFEQLSGGAKEQLGILARLAVATLVDPDDGVPVIIDDALGYTDAERLARVGTVFAGPAERVQVILLTCTPDRYAQIPDAETIDLTA
jgi:energy-coupling factor transporter ATP-binding protein EcfA2